VGTLAQQKTTTAIRETKKDAGVAALLAAFLPLFLFGIGHFYIGKIKRGIILLVLGILAKIPFVLSLPFSLWIFLLLLVSGLINVGLWIWQVFDAYMLAKKYNAEVERTGKAPW